MGRFALYLLLWLLFFGSRAQTDSLNRSTNRDFPIFQADSISPGINDALDVFSVDSALVRQDSVTAAESVAPKSTIETTINYKARDSIFFDMQNQRLNMYGETQIVYGSMTLEAERTDVDIERKTINSIYEIDSTGRKIGKPVFSEQDEVYETDNIVYNLDTKRAQIKGVITAQDGAFMHGDDVKKNEKDEMFIRGARYTTCNLADPHFFIESEKLKVIPGNKVISGPFNLRFREVLTPLWFPFGMFPQPKKKASGIVFPTYGEEARRGFFLRNGGYYFAFNDYIDLRVTGDVYSKGGSGLTVNSNYRKRYAFSGTTNFSYNRNVSDDLENPLRSSDFWFRWNHRQDTRGTSSFSASVSLGTSTYNENTNLVAQSYRRSISSNYSSNISYSKRFQGTPFSMTLNARQNQNVQTGIMTVTLPDFAFTTSRQNPLKRFFKSSNNPFAKLSFSHNFVAKNELTNAARRTIGLPAVANENNDAQDTVEFNLENLDRILERSKIGGRHQIPLSTSITLLRKLTLNPNFNYQEVWYTRELDYTYLPEEQAVRVDTIEGFSRAGSWTSGASLNTIIYGTHFFKGNGAVQAIRHVITPSISFSYNPDFSSPSKGVYKRVQIDSAGTERILSKYEGFVYGSPSGRENRAMSFSIQNNLEMKVRDKKDTTGTGFKKVKVFDNLSFSSSYNFAADSFKLSNIRFSTRTSFLKNAISLNFSGTIDPYVYQLNSVTTNTLGKRVVDQTRLDRYTWNNGQGLGQLTSLNTAININLRPRSGGGDKEEQGRDTRDGLVDDPFSQMDNFGNTLDDTEFEELQYIQRNPDEYVDFDIPWNARISYSINRTKKGFDDAVIRQTLTFGGSLTLTPKTKISFNSGYDMQKKEFTTTRIGVTRDLHCWGLTFNLVPFGRFQSFSLVIQPNSSLLQDLKLQKRRSFQDFFGG